MYFLKECNNYVLQDNSYPSSHALSLSVGITMQAYNKNIYPIILETLSTVQKSANKLSFLNDFLYL